jgi:hypothetical protein
MVPLIFVFARFSSGLPGSILAEFAPVPNSPSDVDSSRTPAAAAGATKAPHSPQPVPDRSTPELGGPLGPEPTRFGDWERRGRCIDF